ncbi:hypothetical protein CMQ_5727 [Grosmannia clavigera kw1407]|uniref:Uncharacterized protein n=1 Tax=Grosmannia clavigera (strain kw1407 / UAMH 11150) TaxID=655863 RepID=F0XSP7_GROCL|nr:uncharacterized protein CMQ_5727 [Grosmannia clavigera kw1407]EFW99306.1 hypothetical protein CMQ_5727 [Grosmannia clavigera kw1407]
MLITRAVRLGATFLVVAYQADAFHCGRGDGSLGDAFTTYLSPNITIHKTTDLVASTVSNATFTIYKASYTGEPDTRVLTSVAVSTVTAAVPELAQQHKGMHLHRAVTTVTEIEDYGTLPTAVSHSTSTKETGAIGTTQVYTTPDVRPTPTTKDTTVVVSPTGTVSTTRPGEMASTGSSASFRSSLSVSSSTPVTASSASVQPSLTIPPTESETTPITTPTSIHHSGSAHSAHGSHNSLLAVMGASLFSIALAFVVAA